MIWLVVPFPLSSWILQNKRLSCKAVDNFLTNIAKNCEFLNLLSEL